MAKTDISWEKINVKSKENSNDIDRLDNGEHLIGTTKNYDYMKFYIRRIKDSFELSSQSNISFSDLKFHDNIVEHWGRHGTIKQCKIHALRLVNQFSKNKPSKKESKIMRGF